MGEGFHQEREAEACHEFISSGLETTLGEYEGCDNSLWFLLKVSSSKLTYIKQILNKY